MMLGGFSASAKVAIMLLNRTAELPVSYYTCALEASTSWARQAHSYFTASFLNEVCAEQPYEDEMSVL
jgi:hypothetical protein